MNRWKRITQTATALRHSLKVQAQKTGRNRLMLLKRFCQIPAPSGQDVPGKRRFVIEAFGHADVKKDRA